MSARERRRPALRPASTAPAAETVPPERAALAERILALLRTGTAAGDLEREIAALRQVLGEVLLAEPDPRQLVRPVARLVEVEVRALRAQRLLVGEKGNDLADLLAQLALELGMTEEAAE